MNALSQHFYGNEKDCLFIRPHGGEWTFYGYAKEINVIHESHPIEIRSCVSWKTLYDQALMEMPTVHIEFLYAGEENVYDFLGSHYETCDIAIAHERDDGTITSIAMTALGFNAYLAVEENRVTLTFKAQKQQQSAIREEMKAQMKLLKGNHNG